MMMMMHKPSPFFHFLIPLNVGEDPNHCSMCSNRNEMLLKYTDYRCQYIGSTLYGRSIFNIPVIQLNQHSLASRKGQGFDAFILIVHTISSSVITRIVTHVIPRVVTSSLITSNKFAGNYWQKMA